jgi:acetylornithine deacetylase
MGRSVSGPEFLETRLTVFLESWLHDLDVRYSRIPIAPGRDNLVAWYDAPAPRARLLFDVHQDTVPVDGMMIPPFVPNIDGGRLFGRGSCDVKGSMAAMMTAFARLVRERPASSASVMLAFTVDEEFTHIGSSWLSTSDHGADLAIVAEPTELNLVDCHKGALRWKVRTKGVACHSSRPDMGQNAIYRMAGVLGAVERHAAELAQSPPDARLGPPTLSVGRIEGGQSVNIVPDWCEIEIDRRMIPGETAADCLTRLKCAIDETLGSPGWLEFGQPWMHLPPLAPRAADWLEPLRNAIKSATGHVPTVSGVPFGTDAGPLSEHGTPCVIFGPGDIAQAHTRDEWIELEQVKQAADAYYQIVVELGSR